MIIGGIILVIVGIIGQSVMKSYIEDCIDSTNTNNSLSSFLGQICDHLVLVRYGAILAVVVGFGMLIYGSIARKKISENESEKIN